MMEHDKDQGRKEEVEMRIVSWWKVVQKVQGGPINRDWPSWEGGKEEG